MQHARQFEVVNVVALPRMKRLSSTRLRLAPKPPNATSCLLLSSALPFASHDGLGSHLLRSPQHRLHNVLVAGAAAEVAG